MASRPQGGGDGGGTAGPVAGSNNAGGSELAFPLFMLVPERRLNHHPRRHTARPASGPRPQGSDFMIFSLGFASVVSLVFIVGDLLNMRPVQPVTITVFVLSTSYCGVLMRRQRVVTVEFGVPPGTAPAGAWTAEAVASREQQASRVLDKESRRRLLEYFIFRPPEEEKGACVDPNGGTGPVNSGGGGGDSSGMWHGAQQQLRPPPPPYMSPPPPPYMSPSTRRLRDSRRGRFGGPWWRKGDTEEEERGAGDCEDGIPAPIDSVDAAHGGGSGQDARKGSALDADGKGSGVSADKAAGLSRGGSGEWSTAGSCIVCFGDYAYGEELCRLPCRHLYHAQCIDQWFDGANHAWCPLCKTDITSPSQPATAAGGGISSHAHERRAAGNSGTANAV